MTSHETKLTWEFIIFPCPWCKKTPKLDVSYWEHSGGTWLWSVACVNYKCKIHPSTRRIGIRKTTKLLLYRQRDKLNTIINEWNDGNEMKPYERTQFFPLVR